MRTGAGSKLRRFLQDTRRNSRKARGKGWREVPRTPAWLFVGTLNALSLGVHVAASGPGVVDVELSDVLAHLDITPCQPAHSAAIRAAEEWAELEEQCEFAKGLAQDANDVFLEKVGNTFVEISLSDDEPEPDTVEDAESAASRGVKAPPSYADLSSLFGHLEQHAESCGIHEAGHFLRKAKMTFLAARAAKPARQSDIGSFTSS